MKQHLKARNTRQRIKAEERRSKVLANPDTPAKELAAALTVHPRTIYRDLIRLRQDLNAANITEYQAQRAAHKQELDLMLDHLLQSEELTDAEMGKLFREYKADVARLLGLNAESRAVVAHISAPESSPPFLKFKSATSGLSDDQMESVYAFARSLVREYKPTAKDASWFPEPMQPQLTEGEQPDDAS
jgi:hypothetical protein